MGKESVLVWNGKADAMYREARRQIMLRNNITPKTIKEIDFADFFAGNSRALAYFPVFQGTTGWWGELLGTGARIQAKIIVSPECQLYEIGAEQTACAAHASRYLFAAEAPPKKTFFQKIKDSAATIKDMIATDGGMILALLAGSGENKIRECIRAGGGEYLGCIGGY